jgi:hypothetical protein
LKGLLQHSQPTRIRSRTEVASNLNACHQNAQRRGLIGLNFHELSMKLEACNPWHVQVEKHDVELAGFAR